MGSECRAHPVLFDLGLFSFDLTPPPLQVHLRQTRGGLGESGLLPERCLLLLVLPRAAPGHLPDLPADGGFQTRPPWRTSANSCPRLLQTDKSGCASQTVDVGAFAPNKHMYVDRFDVSAELEEFGTGRPRLSNPEPPSPLPSRP